MKTVKIGVMPGRIEEVAVEAGTTVEQLINIAGLDKNGYDVKVDGTTITDLNSTVDNANIVLLVRQIKGNASTVKIGLMPGRIEEYAIEDGTSIEDAIAQAGLSTSGYDVKVDGATVTDLSASANNAGIILLVRQIKGNASIKVGVMPGRIEEYAVEDGSTIAQLLEIANLDSNGHDVKVDGNTITDLSASADGAGIVLLVRQIKGNKR